MALLAARRGIAGARVGDIGAKVTGPPGDHVPTPGAHTAPASRTAGGGPRDPRSVLATHGGSLTVPQPLGRFHTARDGDDAGAAQVQTQVSTLPLNIGWELLIHLPQLRCVTGTRPQDERCGGPDHIVGYGETRLLPADGGLSYELGFLHQPQLILAPRARGEGEGAAGGGDAEAFGPGGEGPLAGVVGGRLSGPRPLTCDVGGEKWNRGCKRSDEGRHRHEKK